MFKKGDYVKCVNIMNPDCELRIGKIYWCLSNCGGWTEIIGLAGVWSSEQFVLAEKVKKEIKVCGLVKFLESIKRK